jgi:hypothetical protein
MGRKAMGWKRNKLRWLGSLLLVAASCQSPPELKPPRGPEDFRLPPTSDERFSKPINYPKNKADDDYIKARQIDDMNPSPMGRGAGMSPGVARPYQ